MNTPEEQVKHYRVMLDGFTIRDDYNHRFIFVCGRARMEIIRAGKHELEVLFCSGFNANALRHALRWETEIIRRICEENGGTAYSAKWFVVPP